jgi:hypothetical protein
MSRVGSLGEQPGPLWSPSVLPIARQCEPWFPCRRRLDFIAGLGGAAWPFTARAQQSEHGALEY